MSGKIISHAMEIEQINLIRLMRLDKDKVVTAIHWWHYSFLLNLREKALMLLVQFRLLLKKYF